MTNVTQAKRQVEEPKNYNPANGQDRECNKSTLHGLTPIEVDRGRT